MPGVADWEDRSALDRISSVADANALLRTAMIFPFHPRHIYPRRPPRREELMTVRVPAVYSL
jgi:hypothetical protein